VKEKVLDVQKNFDDQLAAKDIELKEANENLKQTEEAKDSLAGDVELLKKSQDEKSKQLDES